MISHRLVSSIALPTIRKMTDKKQFRLIIDSKIEDVDVILEYAKTNFSSDFLIITNNEFVKNKFNSIINSCKSVDDLVPTDSPQEIASYQDAYDITTSFVVKASDVKYKKVTAISMLKNKIMDELIFLEKIYFILNSNRNNNIILCLTHWNYYHFSCLDMAEMIGFEIDLPLTVKNKELTILSLHQVVEHTKILRMLYGNIEFLNKFTSNHDNEKESSFFYKRLEDFIDKKPTIFLLTTNNFDLYLKPVYPVIKEFEDHKFAHLIFTTDPRAKKFLAERKIDFIDVISCLDYLEFDGQQEIQQIIKKIRDIALSEKSSVLTCFCRYLLNDAFFSEIVEKFKITQFFSEIIPVLKPRSIFVMPAGIDDSEILCNLGDNYGIKTVTTIASSVTSNIRSILHNTTKIIACYGEQAREAYQKLGYKNNRLVLTGNPIYDNIKKSELDDIRSNITQTFKIDFTKPIILVATSSIDKNEIIWMEELLHFAKKNNYDVILKFHPGMEINDPQKRLELYDKDLHLIQKTEVTNFVAISDILITDYSNVGVIAALYDKPIIVANFMGESFPFVRYDEFGIALLATSKKELESSIERILSDKEVQKKLKKTRKKYEYYFNYKNDGMAAARIFKILTSKNSQDGFFSKLKGLVQ